MEEKKAAQGGQVVDMTILRMSNGKEHTAFCNTGVFKEGKCCIAPDKPDFNCPVHKKDICCIVCGLFENGCTSYCERIFEEQRSHGQGQEKEV